MRFRWPRPLKGWRVFAGEVGTIGIGVLLALGAEQAVQYLNDRSRAQNARDAIRGELELNLARLASRTAIQACVDSRIAEIQGLIDSAEDGAVIETPQWIGRPQFWTMISERWDAAAQAGGAALLPPTELAAYGQLYAWMQNITVEMRQEQADWAELRALEHVDRVPAEGQFALNRTLGDARYRAWRIMQHTAQMQDPAEELRLRKIPNPLPAPRSVCVPLDTPRADAIRLSGSVYGEP